MALVGTKEIVNEEVEIHADKYGRWWIRQEDENLGAGDTLNQAVAKARLALNKRKVKVEVNFLTGRGKRGVATGKHARNRKIMTRIGDKSEQLDLYTAVYKPDTPRKVIERMLEIEQESRKLTNERRAIDNEYQFRIGDAVDKAIEKAIAEQEAS